MKFRSFVDCLSKILFAKWWNFFFLVYLQVQDVNDNTPMFSLPEYVKPDVPEDVKIGQIIVKVSRMIFG